MGKPKLRHKITWPLITGVVQLASWVLQHLPRGLLRPLSRFCGGLAYLAPSVRRMIETNLALAFPEADAAWHRQTGRRSIQNLARMYLDFIWCMGHGPEAIRDSIVVPEAEQVRLDKVMAEDAALIFLTPHLGYWESGLQYLNLIGYRGAIVARPLRNPGLDRLITAWRESGGCRVLPEEGAARGLLKALRNDEHVGLLVDQNTEPWKGGVYVDFFGLPVTMSRAPAMFARKCDVPLILVYWVRDEEDRLVFHCQHLALDPKTIDEETLCQRTADAIAAAIREFPDQYTWLYKRWRFIPDDCELPRDAFPWYAEAEDPPRRQK